MTEPRIRIVLADDHALFCAGIKMLIDSQPDLEFVGSAADGEAIQSLVQRSKPDVVLMDIRMPVLDGISATRAIRAGRDVDEVPRVIVLTTHQGDVAVREAVGAGAHGFVMKDATPEVLLDAIRAVHSGHQIVAPTTGQQLMRDIALDPVSEPDDEVIAELSPRERELFLLAARGLSTAEIAQEAFIGENTVKTHISTILRKLGLSSRLQMIAFAYEHGLVR